MDDRATGRRQRPRSNGERSPRAPADPYRALSTQAARLWKHEERTAERLERRVTVLLVGVGAAVTYGAFQVLGGPTAVASQPRLALGSVVLGLVFLGAALLPLLGLAPPAPAAPAGSLRHSALRAFFGEEPTGRTAGGRNGGEGETERDLRRAFVEEAEDLPAPAPASASRAHRSALRASAGAALEIREENRRRRRRIGWAGVGVALGASFLLAGALLSLSAYSAAVLAGLMGATGLLALR